MSEGDADDAPPPACLPVCPPARPPARLHGPLMQICLFVSVSALLLRLLLHVDLRAVDYP